MALKGLTGGLYQPLSSADIDTIHQASLTILENTGISTIGSRMAREMPPHGHGRLREQFWRKKKNPTSPLTWQRPSVRSIILLSNNFRCLSVI
jgi:trimethylamine:corrinoid methyltransferase-like protein